MKLKVSHLVLAGLFVALMVIGAYVKIPMPIVMSVTLQVLFCLLCGLALPPLASFLSMLTYVAIGILGLPVFTFGGGIGAFVQPSFGFLLSFILIAPLCGILWKRLASRFAPWLAMGISCAAALIVMYVIGSAYGYFVMNYYLSKAMSVGAVIAAFCLTFLPIDAAKAVLAILVATRLKKAGYIG